MEVKIIKNKNDLINIENKWKQLEERCKNNNFYLSYDFIYSYCDNLLEQNQEIFIICIEEGDKLLGIAPLVIEKKKKLIKYNLLKFLGKGDYLDFLIDNVNEYSIIKKIFDYISINCCDWDKIRLTNIPENSKIVKFFLKSEKYNENIKIFAKSPYLNIGKYSEFNDFKKYIPKKVNKFNNKIKKEIGYQFLLEEKNYEILYECIDMHIKEQYFLKNEKGMRNHESLFINYKNIKHVKNLFEKGYISIFLLKDTFNEIITYNFCYKYKDTLFSWNSGYNPKYSQYRLTKVRYFNIFKYIIENRVNYKIFDFGADGYQWKFEWTEEWNNLYEVNLLNKNSDKYKIMNLIGKIRSR